MADDFFDRLLAASDVPAVLQRLLPDGRKVRGDEWAAKCPFCNSDEPRDPKFSVNLASTVYKCFKCQQTGNGIRLAQLAWGRAWQKEWAEASPSAAAVLGPQERPQRASAAPTQRSQRTPEEAWKDGMARLGGDHAGLEPLAQAWGIPAAWLAKEHVVPFRFGKVEGFGVPARDPSTGDICDLKRRVLPPIPEGSPKSASWPDGKAGLFGLWALAKRPKAPVVIAEGEKDWAVAAHDLGEDYVVLGIGMGAGCWLPAWTEALRGRDVILAYDPDPAGVSGCQKAAMALHGVAASVRAMGALFAPTGEDAKGKPLWGDGLDLFDFLRGGGTSLVDRSVDAPAALKAHLAAAVTLRPDFDPKAFLRDLLYSLEEGEGEVDWAHYAEQVYAALNKGGARWLSVEGEVWCIFRGSVCRVSGQDRRWRLLIYELTNQTTEEKPGRVIAEVLSLVATRDAVHPDMTPAWAVRKGHVAYMALNDDAGRQVKIGPDLIEVVDNGTDGVVTFPYAEVARPIHVLSDQEFDEQAAEAALDWAVNLFTCDEFGRLFLKWYVLTLPLYPFAQSHPVLRFRGDSASGKSTAAKALTTILYGREDVELKTTPAALYRLARKRPLTCIDNLEERAFRAQDGVELQDFMLISGTGASRKKSASGSDSAVVLQEVKSLFLSTGIEPIGTDKPEINNRTLEIRFDKANRVAGFYEEGNLEQLRKDRDAILNLAFRVCQRTLRDVREGAIPKVLQQFPPHKERLAEFFAILSLAQSGGVELNSSTKIMLESFADEERAANEAGSAINTLFLALPEVDLDKVGIQVEAGSGVVWKTLPLRAPDLFRALSVAARTFGLEMPWRTAHAMSTRLNDETVEALAKVGVTVIRSRNAGSRLLQVKVSRERLSMEPQPGLPGVAA